MAASTPVTIGDGLTWSALRALMERATGRSGAWRDSGLWMLESLEAQLGHEWPTLVARKAPNGGAGELAMAASHVTAYTNLLELALRLELLKGVDGFAKARRAISTDPRPDQLAHSRIQLEVAAIALRTGWRPVLEPNPLRSRPADVAFQSDRGQVVVETRVVLTSDVWRDESRRTDQLFERIRAIEHAYRVRCDGEIADRLTDAASDELVGAVEDRARLIGIGASAPPLRMHDTALQVVPDSRGAGRGLRGPEMGGNSWARIGPRIMEKAERAVESGASWLRLDALNGLWQFTHWAQLPLADKLDALAGLVRGSLGRLDGIVVSSGALLAQGEFHQEDVSLPDWLVALRRLLSPLRVRETLIIPATVESAPVVESWQRVYDDETHWLAWALAQLGLPTPDEIFAE